MRGLLNKGLSRRSFIGLAGDAAAVAGLGLAACGGGGNDEDFAPAEGGKKGGGVITAGSAYAITNFDPSSTSSALACGANWHVVEMVPNPGTTAITRRSTRGCTTTSS